MIESLESRRLMSLTVVPAPTNLSLFATGAISVEARLDAEVAPAGTTAFERFFNLHQGDINGPVVTQIVADPRTTVADFTKNLYPNTRYTLEVHDIVQDGQSSFAAGPSAVAWCTTIAYKGPPAAPTRLTDVINTLNGGIPTSISFRFYNNASNDTAFVVQRGIITTVGNTTQVNWVNVSSLAADPVYGYVSATVAYAPGLYRVFATGKYGNSDFSNTVSVL